MAGQCMKLKWNRRRLQLTQQQFADKVGLSVSTIRRLEWDETAWLTVRNETVDKIYSLYDNMASWQPENANEVISDINDKENVEVEEKTVETYNEVIKPEPKMKSYEYEKTLELIEFVVEGIRESDNEYEFQANMKLLKKIVNKY